MQRKSFVRYFHKWWLTSSELTFRLQSLLRVSHKVKSASTFIYFLWPRVTSATSCCLQLLVLGFLKWSLIFLFHQKLLKFWEIYLHTCSLILHKQDFWGKSIKLINNKKHYIKFKSSNDTGLLIVFENDR